MSLMPGIHVCIVFHITLKPDTKQETCVTLPYKLYNRLTNVLIGVLEKTNHGTSTAFTVIAIKSDLSVSLI